MTFKLIKREFKATYRSFLFLYAAVIAVSILAYISLQTGNQLLQIISSFTLSLGVIPVCVVYISAMITGYINTLYADESYLTHTLPVKGRQIILSKWVMASFWGIATVFIGGVCGFGLMFTVALNEIPIKVFIDTLIEAANRVGISNILLPLMMAIITCVQLLIKIYFSIAVSRLSIFRRFNNFIALLVFVVCFYIQNKLYSLFINVLKTEIYSPTESFSAVLGGFSVYHIIFTSVMICIYFAGTAYITEKKLNIY